ncbi:MAG TPA: (d)CMP kinase [Actinobacteria bacterium]|nr:(d)CMP kinase [Actinomycetota bacterium]
MTNDIRPLVVAVDGPAGSGKSSVCRGTAARLSWNYLDTGAMYRAMTWAVLEAGLDPNDAEAVADFAKKPDIASGSNPEQPTIEVDGTDVADAIREDRITAAVSAVSAVPRVRQILVQKQRDAAQTAMRSGTGIVVEGRDITTVVLPNAHLKIFLTADPEVRAQRRAKEQADGGAVAVEVVQATEAALAKRDQLDSSRQTSPLTKAEDAIELDTSNLTLDQVISKVVAYAKAAAQ